MDLNDRVASLEKKLGFHRRFLIGLSTAGVVAFLAGATSSPPEVLRAERFELIDGGKLLAVLGVDDGIGRLQLLNSRGEEVLPVPARITTRAALDQARKLESERKYQDVVDLLGLAILLHPDDQLVAHLLTTRGRNKMGLHDYAGTVEDCTRAIALDGGLAYAYANRGNARAKLGDKEGAEHDWAKAVELEKVR